MSTNNPNKRRLVLKALAGSAFIGASASKLLPLGNARLSTPIWRPLLRKRNKIQASAPTHYDALLQSWSRLNIQSGVFFDDGNSVTGTNEVAEARRTLARKGWTILDGDGTIYPPDTL